MEAIAPYLEDGRDRVVFGQRPMMMVPERGVLPVLEPGQSRYLAARDGIYIEGRASGLYICLRLSSVDLPFGPVARHIQLDGGRLPLELRDTVVAQAEGHSPQEAAFLATLGTDGRYQLHEPRVAHASASHITYDQPRDDRGLVFDIHTHGRGPAYFSDQDNESDHQRVGPYIALVLGRLTGSHQPEAVARVCIAPHLIDIGVEEVVEVRNG